MRPTKLCYYLVILNHHFPLITKGSHAHPQKPLVALLLNTAARTCYSDHQSAAVRVFVARHLVPVVSRSALLPPFRAVLSPFLAAFANPPSSSPPQPAAFCVPLRALVSAPQKVSCPQMTCGVLPLWRRVEDCLQRFLRD